MRKIEIYFWDSENRKKFFLKVIFGVHSTLKIKSIFEWILLEINNLKFMIRKGETENKIFSLKNEGQDIKIVFVNS